MVFVWDVWYLAVAHRFHGLYSSLKLCCEGPWFTSIQENGCGKGAHQSYLGTERNTLAIPNWFQPCQCCCCLCYPGEYLRLGTLTSVKLSSYGTGNITNITCFWQRTVRNKEEKTSFCLGRGAKFLILSQTSWQDQGGLSTHHNSMFFFWKQVQERERWSGSTTWSGAAKTASTFMGSGSHERRTIKFFVHSGVSSAARELPVRLSPEWVILRLGFVCLPLRLSPS